MEKLPSLLRTLRAALDRFAEADARAEAGPVAAQIVEQVLPLGDHAIVRIAHGVDDLLRDLEVHPDAPKAAVQRTLSQAVDFLATLLQQRPLERGKDLAPAHILAIDDDSELLATVVASLQLAQIQTDGCGSAEEALQAVSTRNYDLVLVDVSLPSMDGTAFCAKARELPDYRKTPMVFLTVTDTLEQRADTSLSGGSDFIGKPFNVFDLALKVQTWVLKHQLGLL
jgi:CheY-like chemotaxis protein